MTHPETHGAYPLVRIVIDRKPYETRQGSHTVAALKELASIHEGDRLDQDVGGAVTDLDQAGTVAIHGDEIFLSFPAKVEIEINGKAHEIRRGNHSVDDLKRQANVPGADQLEQDQSGTLVALDPSGIIAINGGEVFFSFPATVKITVDSKTFEIGRGKQPVSAIKKLGGVPAANQLDQDVNGVLTPLDQNGSVLIKGSEVFVSYPATGSSS
jgi:hypothetical protein